MNTNYHTHNGSIQDQKNDNVDQWFTQFIDHLKVDHLMLQTNSAPFDKREFYNAVMSGDEISLASQVRNSSSKIYVKKIIFDYLEELGKLNRKPIKLAFGISDSKILVWSEIEDDDEYVEDALLITEAKINGKYHSHGFYLNSTIIEKSDNVAIPNHYQTIF